MTATVSMRIDVPNLPTPVIDDNEIAAWVEGRLNDARNTFIMNVSRGSGGGRTYGNHTASRPGGYPVTDTGRLVNSVDIQMHGPHSGALTSDVQYAAWLTDGTRYMAARKMLKDALEEAMDKRPASEALAKAAKFTQTTTYAK
jgi:hypothetical protein